LAANGARRPALTPAPPPGVARKMQVPRRRGVRADESRGHEERGRQLQPPQDGRRDLEIVPVAIIESDGKRTAEILAGATTRDLLGERQHPKVLPKEIAERLELARATRQLIFPQVVGDAMERHDG